MTWLTSGCLHVVSGAKHTLNRWNGIGGCDHAHGLGGAFAFCPDHCRIAVDEALLRQNHRRTTGRPQMSQSNGAKAGIKIVNFHG